MELCSIASGSSGNCICVGSDDCHVLIDAGISGKRIENGLNSIDLKTADMQGILITHEHIDHIAGLGVIARRYGIPMYATGETVDAILHTKTVGKIDEALFQVIESEREFTIGDLVGGGVLGFMPPSQTAWLHNLFTLGIGIESMTPLLKEEKSEDKHTIDITAESTVA